MIELRKDLEDSEQTVSVCDPEQPAVPDEIEICGSGTDPEQTAALIVPDTQEPEYDPEQTAALIVPDTQGPETDPEQTTALIVPDTQGPEYDPEQTAAMETEAEEVSAQKETDSEKEADLGKAADSEKEEDSEQEPGMSEEEDSEVFLFDGMEFRTPSELALYFQSYADISRRALSKKVRELFVDKEHLIPEFESWLIAIGKERELSAWKRKILWYSPRI